MLATIKAKEIAIKVVNKYKKIDLPPILPNEVVSSRFVTPLTIEKKTTGTISIFKAEINKTPITSIGSNKNLNNLEVTKELLKNSKKSIKLGNKVKINFVKDRPGHDIRYALNSNKIKKKLGWQPKTNFSKGIKLTLNWYLKNKSYYKSLSKKDINNRLGKG